MKTALLLFVLVFSACSNRVGDGFRYKKATVSRCKECNSATNAFYISFIKNVKTIPEPEKGVSQIIVVDKYTVLIPISKAYKERRVLKKSIKSIKKINK